jgi:hypothetical protein
MVASLVRFIGYEFGGTCDKTFGVLSPQEMERREDTSTRYG